MAGKYTLIERDYSAADADMKDDDSEGDDEAKDKKPAKESELDKRVQALVSLICDVGQRSFSHCSDQLSPTLLRCWNLSNWLTVVLFVCCLFACCCEI